MDRLVSRHLGVCRGPRQPQGGARRAARRRSRRRCSVTTRGRRHVLCGAGGYGTPFPPSPSRRAVLDSLAGPTGILPLLNTGEALLLGGAVLLPTRIKLDAPRIKPGSATRDFWREWGSAKPDANAITAAVDCLRSQSRGGPSDLSRFRASRNQGSWGRDQTPLAVGILERPLGQSQRSLTAARDSSVRIRCQRGVTFSGVGHDPSPGTTVSSCFPLFCAAQYDPKSWTACRAKKVATSRTGFLSPRRKNSTPLSTKWRAATGLRCRGWCGAGRDRIPGATRRTMKGNGCRLAGGRKRRETDEFDRSREGTAQGDD